MQKRYEAQALFGQLVRRLAFGFLALTACATVCAQLTGQTVHAQYYFPDLSSPYYSSVDSVVGPGVEVSNFPPREGLRKAP